MAAPRFHCRDGWIRDEHGRIRMFRGANVSGRAKLPPFLPFDDPAAFDRLAQWGWNAVRLLVMWEGVSPQRGVVDEAYLARVRALAEAAGSRGLHVVVDLHQDLFSRVHGGDGAPDWAVAARGKPANGRSWFADYALSPAVWRSFAAFWRDEDGIRTEFLGCLRAVMTTMRDVPMVVGYDPFNEPMTEITGLVAFERGPLAELYRACIRLRDELDPGRLLFLEPTPLAAFGLPTALPTFEGANLVYAPHVYDAPAIVASRYMPRLSSFPFTLRALLKESEWREEPLFVGEFGVLNGVDGDARMMEHQCRMLDRHFVSWTVWHYNPTAVDWNAEDASIVEPDGGERPWTGALVRPYPRALAGAPLAWDSHPRRTWSLEYAPRGGVGLASPAATELVVPARWSGGECRVHAVGADARWIDAATPGGAALVEVTARAGVERVRVELERG